MEGVEHHTAYFLDVDDIITVLRKLRSNQLSISSFIAALSIALKESRKPSNIEGQYIKRAAGSRGSAAQKRSSHESRKMHDC